MKKPILMNKQVVVVASKAAFLQSQWSQYENNTPDSFLLENLQWKIFICSDVIDFLARRTQGMY